MVALAVTGFALLLAGSVPLIALGPKVWLIKHGAVGTLGEVIRLHQEVAEFYFVLPSERGVWNYPENKRQFAYWGWHRLRYP